MSRLQLVTSILGLFLSVLAAAQQEVAAQPSGNADLEMAKRFQNPLAKMKAVFTNNAIGFDSGAGDDISYGFQFQPVYAVDFPERGFTLIPRAVIPVLGLEPGTNVPPVGDPTPEDRDSVWGIGDSAVQLMYAPRVKSSWKWGIGPQMTLKTRTDGRLAGPGWGGGLVGILTNGQVVPNLSTTVIVAQTLSGDGDFNTTTIQPQMFYNFPSLPGWFVSYTGTIAADWEASSSNRWTVPLGLNIGRTLALGSGHGLDMMTGPYYNVERPDGAPRWSLLFGISWLFP